MMRTWILGVLAVATSAAAQPLVEHVPGDAAVYVGWAGVRSADSGYDGSITAKVADAANISQSIDRIFAVVSGLAEQDNEVDPEAIAGVRAALAAAWNDPFAFYYRPAMSDNGPAGIIGLIWEVGEGSRDLVPQLRAAVDAMNDEGADAELTEQGGRVTVRLQLDDAGGPAPDTMLGGTPSFRSTLAATGEANPALVGFVDIAALRSLALAGAEQAGEADRGQRVMDALGLAGVTRAVYTGRFTDAGRWQTHLFVAAPEPRQGVVQMAMDRAPLDRSALAATPASASWVSAVRFDPAALLGEIRSIAEASEPGGSANIDMGLAAAEEHTGVNLEQQVLRALGDTWIVYSDPAVVGPGGMGLVLVNPLKDPAAFEQALGRLEAAANDAMGSARDAGGMRFQIATMQQDGLTIHALATPMMTPSWAIADGNLYAALLPQAVLVAHDYAAQDGPSILDSAAYRHLVEVLGEKPHTSVLVNDLAKTAPVMYQQFMMFAQMASGMLAMQGGLAGQQLTMILPPLARIQPYLEPAGSLGWSDARGWHLQSTSPFIGATLLSPSAVASAPTVGLGVGILLPALQSARSTARRMEASTQARGIHQGMVIWANANNGQLPDDIAILVEGNFVTPEYVLSPTHGPRLPHGFKQWPEEQRLDWVRQNTSYIIVPGLTDDLDAERVAVFGDPDHFEGGIPVAWNDNHTGWERDVERIRRLIAEQNAGMTMEQMIERQRNIE